MISKSIIFFISILTTIVSQAQQWKGVLSVMGNDLDLIISIEKEQLLLNIPKQNIKNAVASRYYYNNDSLYFNFESFGISYDGKITNDSIIGYFRQSGLSIPLIFTPSNMDISSKIIPIDKRPVEYTSEDVSFKNIKENITLTGTLNIPPKANKKTPVIVLFNGSGQQDRNAEILGHPLFYQVADYLTKEGYIIFRYDDRGMGGSEGGSNLLETTTQHFADDGAAAVKMLRDRGYTNIGLLGHSEGGMIAPMIANQDATIKFLILLAAPGIIGKEILSQQVYDGNIAMNIDHNIANMNEKLVTYTLEAINTFPYKDIAKMYEYIKTKASDMVTFSSIPPNDQDVVIKNLLVTYNNNWMRFFMHYQPAQYLQNTTIPVLAINGDKDTQINGFTNIQSLYNILKNNNKHNEYIVKPNINHLLQYTNTGNAEEYESNPEDINQDILTTIKDWLRKIH